MNLRELKRFLAVVEYGSINKAATHLNVSQPSLSKDIHELEARLGVPATASSPAGFWDVVKLAGLDPAAPGYGRLFEVNEPAADAALDRAAAASGIFEESHARHDPRRRH